LNPKENIKIVMELSKMRSLIKIGSTVNLPLGEFNLLDYSEFNK